MDEKIKKSMLGFFAIGLLVSTMFVLFNINNAMASTTSACTDDSTLNTTSEIYVDGVMTIISQNTTCPYGCLNNECSGTNMSSDMMMGWFVYATGFILMTISIVLGIPFGISDKAIRSGFNTTIIVKYLFFFIGLFFVYLSTGMMRRVGITYGGESSVIGSIDTVTMVLVWTMIIFFFVFMLELTISFLKMLRRQADMKDREKRGENEEE